MKITPAHDFNDYEVGQRHEMEVINLFTIDAIMNDNAPPAYQGLDRYEARELIVNHLNERGLIGKFIGERAEGGAGLRPGVERSDARGDEGWRAALL